MIIRNKNIKILLSLSLSSDPLNNFSELLQFVFLIWHLIIIFINKFY